MNYKPTFNRGTFRDINAEQLIASLATPAKDEQSNDVPLVGNGSTNNRSRIFVPHFPKRVTEDSSLEIKNELNIQGDQNLKQLISDTDRKYAMNVDPRASLVSSQN